MMAVTARDVARGTAAQAARLGIGHAFFLREGR